MGEANATAPPDRTGSEGLLLVQVARLSAVTVTLSL